jgi:uncharacterized protein YcfL
MKNMRTKQTLLMVVCAFIFFSCQKEKEKENTPACGISMEGLAGSYKITKLQYKASPEVAPADFMTYLEECQKDDITTLYSNGTYKYDDGGLVCEPNESDEGVWLVKDKTVVSDGFINGTVESYDCKTLVYYMADVLVEGDKLTFTAERQ